MLPHMPMQIMGIYFCLSNMGLVQLIGAPDAVIDMWFMAILSAAGD